MFLLNRLLVQKYMKDDNNRAVFILSKLFLLIL